MSADLHVHTTFSDGTCRPEEVVELAKKNGLSKLAITDHDVVEGIEPARKRGEELGIEVIPGIELTTEAMNSELHILGYFIDDHSSKLLETITQIQKGREKRIYKICEKLKQLGVELDPEKVFMIAGHRAAGRPHVARALIEEGYVRDVREAFYRYLDFHGPAYVSHYKLSPEEAIKLINAAGGVAVFGHPAVSNCDQIIPDLMVAGLQGIEAYYIGHDQSQTQHYLNLAKKYGLLVTGGTDYHGSRSGREIDLGTISVPDEAVEKLRAASHEHLRGN